MYALNKIRSLHGLKDLVWNDELEHQAKEWALQLAEDQSSTKLSGVDSLGEIVYVAKGTNECPPMRYAILEWYVLLLDLRNKHKIGFIILYSVLSNRQ